MSAPSPDSRPTAENERRHGDGLRLAPPLGGVPTSAPSPPAPAGNEQRLRELLAPFVAWMATQDLDEPRRRRHRAAAERFLRWSRTDDGPAEDRRRRYEHHLADLDPEHLGDARTGLDRWIEHRHILSRTLPIDS